jgi:hypothetical protein
VRPVGGAATSPVEITVGGTAAGSLAITAPANRSTLTTGDVTLTGIAPPGSEVELVDKGYVIGKMIVAANGQWSWTARPISGSHVYIARLVSDPKTVSNQVSITAG